MKFKNPWIDPRIAQARAGAARTYLLEHGWEPAETPSNTLFPFHPARKPDGPFVYVPMIPDPIWQLERMIELVGDIALAEGRYAGEVLNEILALPENNGAANGAVAEASARPVAS